MPLKNLDRTVIVLDLDDTLYQEIAYVESGLLEVSEWVKTHYEVDIYKPLLQMYKQGVADWLSSACALAGLPASIKESFLWVYRLHSPHIALSDATEHALSRFLSEAMAVAILTDGRSISQRKKLNALGLSGLPAYISEEYDSVKPSPQRFYRIMLDIPAEYYIYIGDNVKKDFWAPNKLGWITYGLRSNGKNIHDQDLTSIDEYCAPHRWIFELMEIMQDVE